jgi:hypothetical protein
VSNGTYRRHVCEALPTASYTIAFYPTLRSQPRRFHIDIDHDDDIDETSGPQWTMRPAAADAPSPSSRSQTPHRQQPTSYAVQTP